jgi:cell division protein FtsI (penicillin-binding protein 3)
MAAIPITRQPVRFGLAIAGFAGLFVWVSLRLYSLQIVQGQTLAQLGEKQTNRVWTLPAARGGFSDANGMPLVESQGSWIISCDPRYMEDRLTATTELSRLLKVPRETLRAQFETNRNGRTLAKSVDDATADAIKALRLTGVYVRREFTRTYREGALAAHVLGFTQADGSGAAGLEAQFNSQLCGTPGKEILQIDAFGKPVVSGMESIPGQPGAHIQLTIDVVLQRALEKEIAAAVEKHAPKHAAGIIIRPATGEILAMSSWPTFVPATREGVIGEALRNNVTQFVYEPGSTFKPLIAGAAVHEKLTSFQETIFCEHGRWTYREGRSARTITDHSLKTGGHGNLTVTDGIAKSDNILMAKLGIRLGTERLYSWVQNLGFGHKTSICLPGEEIGIIPARKRWTVLSECMSIPMGHNIAVTPLQLAMAHSSVANGGMWNPPRLIKRIYSVDADGKQGDLPLPALEPPRRMYEVNDAAAIQEAMTHTMEEGGTGAKLSLDGYLSAGKTGTAEKLVDGRYSNEHHVGSFVCWAPADAGKRPQLLALVVIDDSSKNGHYGGETAGPVVQRVLQFGLEHMKIPKDPALLKEPPPGAPALASDEPPKRKNRGGPR